MTDSTIYILKIILYIINVLLLYIVCSKYKKNGKSIPIAVIIAMSIFYGFYSFICTANPYVMDKKIYALKFSHDIYSEQVKGDSLGLWIIEEILHIFTYNPDILFFLIACLYMFIILVAFNQSKNSSGRSLLLFLLSELPIFGFYQLKQCLAIALVTLAFVNFEKKNKIYGLLLVALAIVFHESALIIVPILLILKASKYKAIRIASITTMILTMVFFEEITSFLLKIALQALPSLEVQTSYFFSSESIIISENLFTIFKGLPYYIISILGIIKRKELKSVIKNYDAYLLLSLYVSFTILTSSYMYWMFRFGTYFCFFTFILLDMIAEKTQKNRRATELMTILVILLLGILSIRQWGVYYFTYGGT